ncbi:hypothetical protein ABZY02_07670, partial [Streptomyces sp. NPDC006649]|uniref:hypothetical protein n=1 Tax=Streptomyces sp. NPDC006649 TaxID=3156896 RepID=UPI0033B96297
MRPSTGRPTTPTGRLTVHDGLRDRLTPRTHRLTENPAVQPRMQPHHLIRRRLIPNTRQQPDQLPPNLRQQKPEILPAQPTRRHTTKTRTRTQLKTRTPTQPHNLSRSKRTRIPLNPQHIPIT